MRKINYIVVHCTATKEGQDFKAKDIDRWHKERGWSKIGYHYVIDLDGTIEKGRKEEEIGSHVAGHNKDSIGIVYVGGLDSKGNPKDTRTEAQKEALWKILTELLCKYPTANILGHRDFKGVSKACPCFDAKKEYSVINLKEK